MKGNTLLKIDHVSKSIGKREILHDVSFEAYAGEVFGFLGPNGAGKTTTIKILTGLLSLDKGSIYINGIDINKHFESAMSNIGAIVENPEMYKYLTGMENLKQCARMRGGIPQQRIDEVVHLVKLSNRINDKVSKYSLGMRQRLGVAQAILHKPKILILDEPTNGLDPEGIKELRNILKTLAHNENICVLVSSHLMSEMELMCDRVGIIAGGNMIGVHTLDEMISATNNNFIKYVLNTNDAQQALETIKPLIKDGIVTDNETLEFTLPSQTAKDDISNIVVLLCQNNIKVFSISPTETKKLEDVFINLTNNLQGGGQIG
ncbi:MAG: ABC transporter ATP-binding protein [Oscillospiraceae bacterium]